MSTVHKTRGRGGQRPDKDPFRYGWRYVKRKGKTGRAEYDQVPLTLEDVLHPQEGDFIVNDTQHEQIRYYLRAAFELVLRTSLAVVLTDCRVAWDVPGLRPHGPDVAVILGVPRRRWSTFDVAREGVRPALIIEITSPETRNTDLVTKRKHYYRAGVPYYIIIDEVRQRGRSQLQLIGYERGARAYRRLRADQQGRLWLEPVGLWLGIEGDGVACYDQQGRRLGTLAETAQALDAETRARADEAQARAAAEQARAAAEARTQELEVELRRLRGEE